MQGKHLFVIVVVELATFVNAQIWSNWGVVRGGFYKRRVQTCMINGNLSTGLECVKLFDPYEEEVPNNCNTCSPSSPLWIYGCFGSCYDASAELKLQCENYLSCYTKIRCYNQATCFGSWKKITKHCSKTCGGGKTIIYRKCFSEHSPSYNCIGTGGNIDYVDVQIAGDCNTEICPTWSNWASNTLCSQTCGGGSKTLTSTCTYKTQPSLLCGGYKTFRTKTETCNTGSCSTSSSTTTTTSLLLSSTQTTNSKKRPAISTTKQSIGTLDEQETFPTTNQINTSNKSAYSGAEKIGIGAGFGAVLLIIVVAIVVAWIRKQKATATVETNPESPPTNVIQEVDHTEHDIKDLYAVVNKKRKPA